MPVSHGIPDSPGLAGFSFSYQAGTRPEAPFVLINRHDPDRGIGVSELWDLNLQSLVSVQTWPVDQVWSGLGRTSQLDNYPVNKSNPRYAPYHTLLLADGRLLSQYETPVVQADACGRLSAFNAKYLFHHSMERDADGNIWVPATLEPKTVDLGDAQFLDDAVTKLSPAGELLFSRSVSAILMENDLGYLLVGGNDFLVNNDPIHLNDIQPVLEDGPYYKRGDLFLSMRHLSMLMLYRPSTDKILWYALGKTFHQHDVDILSDHEISAFDNNTAMRDGTRIVNGANRFVVYNFADGQFREEFGQAMRTQEVRTPTNGRSELLADGSLFVEESDMGRMVDFAPDGSVDWTYVNRDERGDLITLTWSRIVPRELGEKFLSARKDATCD